MCTESLSEGKCFWNKNVTPFICKARTCENSDKTASDEECNNFLSNCTVNEDKT